MPANSKMQNKALEGMKANKTKSGKGAFASKAAAAAAKTKTPLAGMAISAMLKMNRLKPKK
jgi:hypothetical protein